MGANFLAPKSRHQLEKQPELGPGINFPDPNFPIPAYLLNLVSLQRLQKLFQYDGYIRWWI